MSPVFVNDDAVVAGGADSLQAGDTDPVVGRWLDMNALRRLADETSPELVPRMVGIFIDELCERAATIDEAARGSDIASLERESHVLKSSAALFGVPRVRAAAEQLNAACKAKEMSRMLELVDSLLYQIRTSVVALRANYDLPKAGMGE